MNAWDSNDVNILNGRPFARKMSATRPEKISQAVNRQRRLMSMNGQLDLSGVVGYERDGLSSLGSQKALVQLILDYSTLTSLATLPEQPCMKEIKADNSQIETLAGLARHRRLCKLSLIDTPVSRIDNFRLTALLCVGPKLSSLNETPITDKERKMVAAFPPIAKKLADNGWVAVYPPPSEPDFRYLAEKMGIEAKDDDFAIPAVQLVEMPETNKDENDLSFAEKLAGILRPLGFMVRCGDEMHYDIVTAVSDICNVLSNIADAGENKEQEAAAE